MNHITEEEIELKQKETTTLQPELGIETESRVEIANGLKQILSNSYLLMIKTHNYHWNIRGTMFMSVHGLTEQFYTDLFEAVDDLAERIRSLGFLAPGSFKEFSHYGEISDNHSHYSDLEMVQDLLESNELVARNCRKLISISSNNGDEATADLLTVRLGVHEKNAWMYRSFLEK